MSNNQPTTPTMYHVVEKDSDDKVQTVWSYNTYQAAVVQLAVAAQEQADHNQALRAVHMGALRGDRPPLTGDEAMALDRQFKWSTFSIEPCPGTGCCPACIAVRRVEQ